MLDFGYCLIGGQALIYTLATLYLIRRLRRKGGENQQLSGEVSVLKLKLWDEKRKLKNAQDHITLLEHDNAVFLRREIDRIKNRNKPTAVVVEESTMNFAMHAECDRLRTANKDLTDRLQSVYDSNRNKYEEYKALSDEVRVLKKRVADLLKENVELKDLANSLGACKTHLANVIETLTNDNKRLRESRPSRVSYLSYRDTTY